MVKTYLEQCNDVRKGRFRCLLKHRVLHYSPERASKIINVYAVLHDICINNNFPDVPPEAADIYIDYRIFSQGDLCQGDDVNNC